MLVFILHHRALFRTEIGLNSVGRVKVKWSRFRKKFFPHSLDASQLPFGGGSGHSYSAGDVECLESFLANHSGGGKRAGPVDIYAFVSLERAPVLAQTKFYLYDTRKNKFTAASMNLRRSK
jgi:hypothetical protein